MVNYLSIQNRTSTNKRKNDLDTGTTVDVKITEIIDGDTIYVTFPNSRPEKLRMLAIDTEESHFSQSKEITTWGLNAKKRAEGFFKIGDIIQVEFPGTESEKECLTRYLSDYGRLSVLVRKNGIDYQELMIQEGYSPYYYKYGFINLKNYHEKYMQAEEYARQKKIGLWSPLHVIPPGEKPYSSKKKHWQLRAEAIEGYRAARLSNPHLLNTRLDYYKILEHAKAEEEVTIFTEIRGVKPVHSNAIIFTGSQNRRFSIFFKGANNKERKEYIDFLHSKYISTEEDFLKKNYAYISGRLHMHREKPQIDKETPQMIITSSEAITDEAPN